jgi:succinate dehydrogenase / fumarate reductase flavoprotein subunit
MQGLADGYFILPYTIAHYLAEAKPGAVTAEGAEFRQSREEAKAFTEKLLSIKGRKTSHEFHRELGKIMWDQVGMTRSEAGLKGSAQKDTRTPV